MNIPSLATYYEDWRILQIKYDWQAKGKKLRQTLQLVKKYEKIPHSVAWMEDYGLGWVVA